MQQSLFQIALVVKDYGEAIQFYTNKLRFQLIEDTFINTNKRWVIIKPPGNNSCKILLAKAKNQQELKAVGNQTGERVFLFMYTDDLHRDYQNLLKCNVRIVRKPSVESFGKVLVFADLYGNLWDLIEPSR